MIEKYGEARYRELRSLVTGQVGHITVTQIRNEAIAKNYEGLSIWHVRWIGNDLGISFKLKGSKVKLTDEEAEAISEARLITEIFAAARV